MEVKKENNGSEKIQKKRGRKPKGDKLVIIEEIKMEKKKPNIILHLKCSIKDIDMSDSEIKPFSFSCNNKNSSYIIESTPVENVCQPCVSNTISSNSTTPINMEEILKKLSHIEYNIYGNVNKSCCFWDTCSFDNIPFYIPKYRINDTYYVYGCFCSPECAISYLLNENLTSKTKFERYSLINYLYCDLKYYTDIKPSPDPRYTLDKFYGSLSINEYRAILNVSRLFLTIDKPISKSIPEIHQDNDNFTISKTNIIPTMRKNYKESQ